jgi:hypothetical protein
MKVALYLHSVPSVASDVLIVVCERTDQYCASTAPILVCLSTIVRLPPRFVSRNVSGKPPIIASRYAYSSIHALMQDTDDGDAVTGQPKINDVLLDTAPSIAWSDVGTALRLLRGFSQISVSGFDKVGVAHRLGQAPMRHGMVEHPIKVTLRPRAKPVFSHAARLCAA